MKKIFLLLSFVLITEIHAQESSYEQVKILYENFEYDKVIQMSSDLLAQPQIHDSVKIDIYLIRAVSFFAKGNSELTKNSFQNILSIRKDYSPTTQILNPTLLKMFNNLKLDYLQNLAQEEAKKDSATTVSQIIYKKQISFGGAFLKNMLLPGWGQLSYGKDRGLLYSLVYAANLGALIYYLGEVSKKEEAYLKEVDDINFDRLYEDYNKSYKMRNNLLISWAVILVYSQIDLLLFHNEEQIQLESNKISIQPSSNSIGEYGFSVKIPL
jgi:hypothetical protein